MLAAPILLITQLSFTAAGFEPRIRKAFHLIQGLRATCDARISVAGTGNIGLSAIRSHIHGIGRWGKLNIATLLAAEATTCPWRNICVKPGLTTIVYW